MNEIVINNTSLGIKEYNGQRVVTFKDIDSVHNRPEGTARRNFNTNKEYFIEGEDYFVRNSYEAKTEFGITAPNGLMLITESGYLMLVKSFTDDLAWDVQRQLVKSYFKVQQEVKQLSPAEMIAAIANNAVELEKRQNALEKRQTALEEKLEYDRDETIKATFEFGRIGALQRDEITKAVKKRAIEICRYAETYDKVSKSVISSIYKALQKHFDISSYLDLAYNQYTNAMIFIQYFEPNKNLYIKILHNSPTPDMRLLNMFSDKEGGV